MSVRYLAPDRDPPSSEDYNDLYAQFIALILSTGKVAITVPHGVKHPDHLSTGRLIVEKRVDTNHTTYTVTKAPT